MRIRNTFSIFIGIFLLVGMTAPVFGEVHVGGPVKKNGLAISAVYLKGIDMKPTPPVERDEDVIHMECDLSATENNKQGFPEGAWVPYLTCAYQVERVNSEWSTAGVMLPMVAKDGPHYANNIELNGKGLYRVTYYLYPPSQNGFFRHADAKTGVEEWWEPFKVSWTFEYPSKNHDTEE